MTGELFINGVDVYVQYGVTPLKGTFSELLKPVSTKPPLVVDFDNDDGEEVLFPLEPMPVDARSFNMQIALVADNQYDFHRKKAAFEIFLRDKKFMLYFSKLPDYIYTCYFEECTQYSQLEPFTNRRVSAILNLKLREPNPAARTLNKEDHAYGVIIDDAAANPDLTRCGNADMAKAAVVNELAVQGTLLNGYLKRFRKGTALYYEDGTASILDGSAGDVVTHHPGFYFLVEDVSSTVHKLWVSPYPISGFTKREFTAGCFEAAANNTAAFGVQANALWSVMNTTTVFRGGNNDAANDALQKGFLGKARTVLSRTDFWNYAQRKGTDYGMIDYNTHVALWMLFVTKYATLNSQKAFSATKDTNGYFTGGLGVGVTDVDGTAWNNYNGYYPLVTIGRNLSSGTTDSVSNYTITEFTTGVDEIVAVPSFMGIENPFGHLWEWTQGINIWKQTEAEGNKFLSYIYNNGVYEDTITNKYARYFEFLKIEGWTKNMILGPNADLLASVVNDGASSSTFYCDYYYNSLSAGYRGLWRSGYAASGTFAGLAYASTSNAVSNAFTFLGSRLGFYGRVRPGV
ncbi:MAG: hypothetical protein A2W90_14680 [Bacteroidetes bacterium GWF2_42_66]|nr:MAG: hypothetical protein A2W92_16075 [Bacteroidetes bacterium GWA2_42_15]OFX99061.1 MAG: hypothetical protein A2W89_06580 [Bacteroidetes bacterium GWE2_42_39]OFY46770.1 MAG: hypothetical protein A2W90_14680 [Bacteroidetes bacterium GWF2_42_66]HAZ04546.1 hypothetical protein [Marinilabiliales bacterium]HBL73821.1 hypothetical protein [Prolixibacteraceae bacterium]